MNRNFKEFTNYPEYKDEKENLILIDINSIISIEDFGEDQDKRKIVKIHIPCFWYTVYSDYICLKGEL